jgi:hypothetical protein
MVFLVPPVAPEPRCAICTWEDVGGCGGATRGFDGAAALTGWGCATFLITIGLRVSEPAKCARIDGDIALRLLTATTSAARSSRGASG